MRKSLCLVLGQDFLSNISNAQSINKKLNYSEMKKFCSPKKNSVKGTIETKPQAGRKYLKISYLIKDFYPNT